MYLFENPVLQRELLVNLRMTRAFVLLLAYVGLLGLVVYFAWPSQRQLDLTTSPQEAKRLVNMFFLGQYVLLSLMTPSFSAGSIAGEKERKTYEMLLASPMRPLAIVQGKLLAALCHLAVLVFCSLPIVMLCLPLGGVSLYEVLATYVAMAASVVTFGMISLACSSYFTRTAASLVVSYLLILPLALFAVLFYNVFETAAWFRLSMLAGVFPGSCAVLCGFLMTAVSARLLHPPDLGAEAREVVDLDEEQREAVGMVIHSDQWPDRMFAPPKRTDLMADQANPVYDKEMRSELFGHGTLMLRIVIQSSMGLALVVMAVCLFIFADKVAWYTSYVLLFNMLVGPVFSASSVTSERERETLELLLTTTLSPWQILSGKLVSSLRVSCVLTSFLVWPILLAWVMPPWTFWEDTATLATHVVIILLTSLTTTILAMFCSVIFRKTSVSMVTSYLIVILLFAAPVAVKVLVDQLHPAPAAMVFQEPGGVMGEAARFRLSDRVHPAAEFEALAGESLAQVASRINELGERTGVKARSEGESLLIGIDRPNTMVQFDLLSGSLRPQLSMNDWVGRLSFTSPFAATFALPLSLRTRDARSATPGSPEASQTPLPRAAWEPITTGAFLLFYLVVDILLIGTILWLFNIRWRVAQ